MEGANVRQLLGIPAAATKFKLDPAIGKEFRVYVQSTSHNRNLVPGTNFIYQPHSALGSPAPAVAAAPAPLAPTTTPAPTGPSEPAAKRRPAEAVPAAAAAAAKPAEPATKRGRTAAAPPAPAPTSVSTPDTPVEAEPATKRTRAENPPTPTMPTPRSESVAAVAPPVVPAAAQSESAGGLARTDADDGPRRVEIVFSVDTTASMYPCLASVRRDVCEMIARLRTELPNVRVGVIRHSDYSSPVSPENVLQVKDLTRNVDEAAAVVEGIHNLVSNDDTPECYELVLRDAQKLTWSADADEKVLVIIGDSFPHEVGVHGNAYGIDWREEARKLRQRNIKVHSVQTLHYEDSTYFYKEVAEITGGHYFQLDQFPLLSAVTLSRGVGFHLTAKISQYTEELKKQSSSSRSVLARFNTLLGRSLPKAAGPGPDAAGPVAIVGAQVVDAVPPGRFQVLRVDRELPIKEFAQMHGLKFKAGKGFYEFTKPESISDNKEIVLVDKTTGDMFSGSRARELLGLTSATAKDKFQPTLLDRFRVFVQSTSVSRKLVQGTGFLYEVDA